MATKKKTPAKSKKTSVAKKTGLITKNDAIKKVKENTSSIFSKADVLAIIDSIIVEGADGEEIVRKMTDKILDKIRSMTTEVEEHFDYVESWNVVDRESAKFELAENNREIYLTDVDIDLSSYCDSVVETIEQFAGEVENYDITDFID